jgi:hypothetical protein
MAIIQGMCVSFKKQVLEAAHDFRVGGNVFKIALYSESANIGPQTTEYTTAGEIVGLGYTAGGIALTNVNPVVFNSSGITNFANAAWPAATFSARGALIYNSTPVHTYTNPACIVLDFGIVRSVSAQTFTVIMPSLTDASALVRIS